MASRSVNSGVRCIDKHKRPDHCKYLHMCPLKRFNMKGDHKCFIKIIYIFLFYYRLTYNEELINWCDVVVPCGGDGTFLLAASRVRDAK